MISFKNHNSLLAVPVTEYIGVGFFFIFLVLAFSGNAQKFIRQRPTVGHLTDWYKGHLSTEMENLIDLLCPCLLSIARAPHASHGLLSCQAMKNHQS